MKQPFLALKASWEREHSVLNMWFAYKMIKLAVADQTYSCGKYWNLVFLCSLSAIFAVADYATWLTRPGSRGPSFWGALDRLNQKYFFCQVAPWFSGYSFIKIINVIGVLKIISKIAFLPDSRQTGPHLLSLSDLNSRKQLTQITGEKFILENPLHRWAAT